jgi:hypothetical protein
MERFLMLLRLQILFLNLDAAFNLFTNYKYLMDSWVQQRLLDRIIIDEVHTIFSESRFRSSFKVYEWLPDVGRSLEPTYCEAFSPRTSIL